MDGKVRTLGQGPHWTTILSVPPLPSPPTVASHRFPVAVTEAPLPCVLKLALVCLSFPQLNPTLNSPHPQLHLHPQPHPLPQHTPPATHPSSTHRHPALPFPHTPSSYLHSPLKSCACFSYDFIESTQSIWVQSDVQCLVLMTLNLNNTVQCK